MSDCNRFTEIEAGNGGDMKEERKITITVEIDYTDDVYREDIDRYLESIRRDMAHSIDRSRFGGGIINVRSMDAAWANLSNI